MTGKKARLTIDLEPDVHARLKIVAARRRTTMRHYTVQAIERQLSEEPTEYLTAREAPVLAELWDNPDDAVYDDV
jgi:predicted transcriptional regulator